MTDATFRLMGWGIPGFFILCAAGTILMEQGALDQTNDKHTAAIQEMQKATEEKAMVEGTPPLLRYAAIGVHTSEETRFLNDLRIKAARTGTAIVGWTSKTSQYGADLVATDASDADLLKGLYRVTCDVDVKGSYPNLRAFIAQLTNTRRLFNLTNVAWHRSDEGSELTMSVVRYVNPAQAPPLSAPPPQKS